MQPESRGKEAGAEKEVAVVPVDIGMEAWVDELADAPDDLEEGTHWGEDQPGRVVESRSKDVV